MTSLLTSEEIWNLPVITGSMGKPDECGLKHKPGRVLLKMPPSFGGDLLSDETYCLVCGMRLETEC